MKFTDEQEKTLASLTKVTDDLYTLVYQNDYDLASLIKARYPSTSSLFKNTRKNKNRGGLFACSLFDAFDEDGNVLVGRNFDYGKYPVLAVWTSPKDGYRSLSLTTLEYFSLKDDSQVKNNIDSLLSAPYFCMDGINEKGLFIGIAEIVSPAGRVKDKKKAILPELAIRYVLDHCSSSEETIAFFSSHEVHDSPFCNYHFLVVDELGNSVVIEFVKGEMKLIYPKDKKQCLTNFFLSEAGKKKGFGFTRYQYLDEVIHQKPYLTKEESLELLSRCHLDYLDPWGKRIVSQWSAVYETQRKSLSFCVNLDYQQEYLCSLDEPGKITKTQRSPREVPPFAFDHGRS